MEFDSIRKWLVNNSVAEGADKKYFEMYVRGEITISDCRNQCMKNNNFPKHAKNNIDDDLFKAWLKSIGYSSRRD